MALCDLGRLVVAAAAAALDLGAHLLLAEAALLGAAAGLGGAAQLGADEGGGDDLGELGLGVLAVAELIAGLQAAGLHIARRGRALGQGRLLRTEQGIAETRERLDKLLLTRSDYDNYWQAFNIAKAVCRYSFGLSKKVRRAGVESAGR